MKIDLSKLTANELDSLITEAAQRRSQMQPAIPSDPPKTANAIDDPRWFFVLANDGKTICNLRHPGLGWVTFLFPPNERAHILSVLLHQALFAPAAKVPDVPSAGSGGGTVH